MTHRPDGIAALYAVKRVEASVDATKAFRPNVSAIVQGSMIGEGAFQTNQIKESWLAGIELNWNIFDNNLTNTEVARAKSAQLEKAMGLPIEIDTAL